MSSPKKPETPVRIESESTFREKVGLTGSPIALEWKKDQVLETTEGALTQLRDELSGKESADEKRKTAEEFLRSQEQSEASGSIEDKLEKAISSGVTDKLKASGIAVGVAAGAAAAVHGLDSQIEKTTGVKIGIKESLKEWFKEAMNDNTFYLGFLWKALYHAFGGKEEVGEKPEGEKPEAEKPREDRIRENAIIARNGVTARLLVRLSPAKEELIKDVNKKGFEGAPAVITHPAFLDKTPQEIFALAKKYPTLEKAGGIEKEFGKSDIEKNSSSHVWHAVIALAYNESFLSNHTKDQNWKTKKFSELFGTFANELEILNGFENINSKDDLIKYFEADMFGISDGKIGANITQKIESLKGRFTGLDTNLALQLFTNPPADFAQARISKKPEQILFLNTLEGYQKSFTQVFLTQKSLNLGVKDFGSFFTGANQLRPDEVLKLFIVTGGKTNFAEFTTTEKILYYKTYMSLVRAPKRDTNNTSYEIATKLINEITSKSTEIVPEDVKKILRNTLGGVARGFISEAGDFVRGTFDGLSGPQKAAVLAAGSMIIMIIPQLRIAKIGLMMLIAGLGIGGVTIAQAMTMDEKDLQKKVEDHQKTQKK